MIDDRVVQLKLRSLTDLDFRKQVLADPEAALHGMGIEPTPDLLDVIRRLIKDLRELGEILGIDDIEAFS
jgi:hypothetical protein